jgi:hypothetical protein
MNAQQPYKTRGYLCRYTSYFTHLTIVIVAYVAVVVIANFALTVLLHFMLTICRILKK